MMSDDLLTFIKLGPLCFASSPALGLFHLKKKILHGVTRNVTNAIAFSQTTHIP